jgi:hypothetical protein
MADIARLPIADQPIASLLSLGVRRVSRCVGLVARCCERCRECFVLRSPSVFCSSILQRLKREVFLRVY